MVCTYDHHHLYFTKVYYMITSYNYSPVIKASIRQNLQFTWWLLCKHRKPTHHFHHFTYLNIIIRAKSTVKLEIMRPTMIPHTKIVFADIISFQEMVQLDSMFSGHRVGTYTCTWKQFWVQRPQHLSQNPHQCHSMSESSKSLQIHQCNNTL